jgi:hypothetical protein
MLASLFQAMTAPLDVSLGEDMGISNNNTGNASELPSWG